MGRQNQMLLAVVKCNGFKIALKRYVEIALYRALRKIMTNV